MGRDGDIENSKFGMNATNTFNNFNTVDGGFNTTKSVFSMKGAAFKSPVSLTRAYFSLEDLSMLTDAKL